MPLALILMFRIAFAVRGVLCFHMDFWIFFWIWEDCLWYFVGLRWICTLLWVTCIFDVSTSNITAYVVHIDLPHYPNMHHSKKRQLMKWFRSHFQQSLEMGENTKKNGFLLIYSTKLFIEECPQHSLVRKLLILKSYFHKSTKLLDQLPLNTEHGPGTQHLSQANEMTEA